jgi:nitroreductase
MDIPNARWYTVIQQRRSRRRFDLQRPVQPADLAALDRICREFRPFPGTRSILVNNPSNDIFKGILGSYGKVTGAPAFLAFVGDATDPFVQEVTGYTGQGAILEATALGLSTCWVGGFFNPRITASLIEIKPGERILAVSPVGYPLESESLQDKIMAGFGRNHKRLPVSSLVSSRSDEKPAPWINAAIESARLAPSAANRQPWGFEVQEDGITVFVRTLGPGFGVSKRLDCGIAMLHLEIAAATSGIRGEWQFLQPPQVARFVVKA